MLMALQGWEGKQSKGVLVPGLFPFFVPLPFPYTSSAEDSNLIQSTETTNRKDKKGFCSFLWQYWRYIMLFHESPRTKMSYSMLSEIAMVFYFSYYLRNELLYSFSIHDFIIFGLITSTMIGKLKATFPSFMPVDNQSEMSLKPYYY